MHNYEQKVLLIYDSASPRLCHLNGSLFPRLGRFCEAPAPGVMPQSREASGRKLVKLGKLGNCGRKSAFFKRNQSSIALTAQAGAQAPRPTRLSVKSSPCRRYESRALVLGINGLTARTEALAPYCGKKELFHSVGQLRRISYEIYLKSGIWQKVSGDKFAFVSHP